MRRRSCSASWRGGRRAAGNPFVFPSRVHARRCLENLRGAWARAKKLAGLPKELRIHDLRHSFASALANSGIPLNEIGTVLGHSQLSTTARYAHHAPQRLVETATTAQRAWNLPFTTLPHGGANPVEIA